MHQEHKAKANAARAREMPNAQRRPARAELIWDGKYDTAGRRVAPLRVALPFQTVETVNESAQDRQRSLQYGPGFGEEEWRNRVIWGDKKYVLPSLLAEFAGQVNLIYIDPPFDTGADFSFTATVPDDPETPGDDSFTFTKEPSIIEHKAYRDTWGRGLDSYLQWFYETILVIHELLHDAGTLYVHLDWHVGHYAKVILDEIFGKENFGNEIIWRRTNVHNSSNAFGQIHDIIFRYTKSALATFSGIRTPYSKSYVKNRFTRRDTRGLYDSGDLTGPGVRTGDSGKPWKGFNPTKIGRHWQPPKSLYEQFGEDIGHLSMMERLDVLFEAGYIIPPAEPGMAPRAKVYVGGGLPLQDLWAYQPHTKGALLDDTEIDGDVASMPAGHPERLAYDTQKPEGLMSRIVRASSQKHDLVLDCFCGSGTTAAVAEKLDRRWIVCDLGRFAIHTTRKRLLCVPNVHPFVVQNLGKYERQLWAGAEFGEANGKKAAERQRAYVEFVLKLATATPIHGYTWLHGVKAGRMVHGAVDAPVSVGDVTQIAAEFKRAVGTGKDAPTTNSVDVLGWDFAFELNEVAKQQAAAANIQMRFLRIPRDVMDKRAVEQGDIRFFELAALSVEVKTERRNVTLKLKDFVIPPDDVPEQARRAVKHWSQWIDYWAVDWDNKGDTFHNEWQTYRTRKDKSLLLETARSYVDPGEYTVVVKVIDILGNDTTKTVKVRVL
jgi:adenine-specific DNA-methyltransferase